MKTPKWFLKKSLIACALLPVSWVYLCISRMVFRMRAHRPLVSRRPIVCVGNILAGGVGKTPIVRQIAEFLDAPVVMRGYKKSNATNNIGDEALMLSRHGLLVHTGDRKSNIILLNKQKSDTPIVMDDGFQNPSIKKDISIIVVDSEFGFGNGFLLPAGPKRERVSALRRADAIIVIKSSNAREKNVLLPAGVPVFYAENKTISPYKSNQKLVAFAGIGYPEKFFRRLENVVKKISYSDHYQYTDADIKKLRDLAAKMDAKLVTTEKDWVRLPAAAQKDIKFAELDTKIEKGFFVWLKEKLNGDFQEKN